MISVIMAVYNGEEFLKPAIESILNQTYTDFEFIIVNDGSTDKSREIICSYTDQRIRLIDNDENKGLVFSLNRGVSAAKGKYIARMDADDISMPARFEKQVSFLESNPATGVCGTWYRQIGLFDKTVKTPVSDNEIRLSLFFNSAFGHPSVMMRKEILDDNNLSYKNIQYAEDYMLWVELSEVTKMANLPEVLLLHREHEAGISISNQQVQNINAAIPRKLYFKSLFGERYNDNSLNSFCLSLGNANLSGITERVILEIADIYNFIYLFLRVSKSGNRLKYLNLLVNSYDSFLRSVHSPEKRALIRICFKPVFRFLIIKRIKQVVKRVLNVKPVNKKV